MLGSMAIGLAVLGGAVPPSIARDSRVLDHCMSAGAGIEAKERQTQQRLGGTRGVAVAEPIGRVCVGPDVVDGGPAYVRRTTAKEGMSIVEVSATPFAPVLPQEVAALIVRPDQPAGW